MAGCTDGKIVLAGSFDHVNGMESRTVVRLKPDGSLDSTFTVPPEFTLQEGQWRSINALAVQADGKVLVGGDDFGVVRLNSNGSLDSEFNRNGLAESQFEARRVNRIVLQPDGGILVAVIFDSFGGLRRYVVRLHGDSPLFRLGTPEHLANGTIRFRVLTPEQTTKSIEIQASSQLSSPDWEAISVDWDLSDPRVAYDRSAGTAPQRFYRAVAR
jgi:uncharacterized delta-60 repeat protein